MIMLEEIAMMLMETKTGYMEIQTEFLAMMTKSKEIAILCMVMMMLFLDVTMGSKEVIME